MTTDNRTNEPTEAQVERAKRAFYAHFWMPSDAGYEDARDEHEKLDEAMRAALEAAARAAQGAAPARPVIDREAVAREVYRELYPGTIGTHDSKRTPESDLVEVDRAYLTWDNGNEGFAPGIICRRVADRVITQLQAAPAHAVLDREALIHAIAARHWDEDSGDVENWDELTASEKQNVIDNYLCPRVADAVIVHLRTAPPLPSSGVDEDALARLLCEKNYLSPDGKPTCSACRDKAHEVAGRTRTMSDFVPTTEQVRQAYGVAHQEVGASYEPDEFDRWLAEVERAAAEKAWWEGHAAGRDYQGDGWNCDAHDPEEDNPYRLEAYRQERGER